MKILAVDQDSPASEAGIRAGDVLVSINGGPARDALDLMYYGAEDVVRLVVGRADGSFSVALDGDEDMGMVFEDMALMSCGNRCVFCFIDQNPRGMRPDIYVKDEDFRYSFLDGTFVTLTTLGDAELARIEEQRLSPLYVSVHATDPAVRRTLLGIGRDDALMAKIRRLVDARIMLHCQIVVCPGINDGAVLEQTIADLRSLYPGVASVAVVPVGLTAHREGLYLLTPVDSAGASAILDTVDVLHGRYRAESGEGFVYCADEFYIRAGRDIPRKAYYDDYPQFENGVGMVRDFIDTCASVRRRIRKKHHDVPPLVLVTGVSMAPYLDACAAKIAEHAGIAISTIIVTNRFFGESVTVAGLLTGGDIIDGLRGRIPAGATVVLPPTCLNHDGVFLDDVTLGEVIAGLGAEVIRGSYDLIETVKKHLNR